jgi:hypothetical protein
MTREKCCLLHKLRTLPPHPLSQDKDIYIQEEYARNVDDNILTKQYFPRALHKTKK